MPRPSYGPRILICHGARRAQAGIQPGCCFLIWPDAVRPKTANKRDKTQRKKNLCTGGSPHSSDLLGHQHRVPQGEQEQTPGRGLASLRRQTRLRRLGTDGSQTPRRREMDSNRRSPAEFGKFRLVTPARPTLIAGPATVAVSLMLLPPIICRQKSKTHAV